MKEKIKDILRLAVLHFFIITVCVMFVVSAVNLLFNRDFSYSIDGTFPWVMMLTGLLGALPTLLYFFPNEPTRKQFYLRVVLHYLLINAAILGEGWLLGWFATVPQLLIIAAMILVVYGLVWLFSTIAEKTQADNINKALQRFNEDEEPQDSAL